MTANRKILSNWLKRASSDWCHIFTFRDGKVAKFREFLDTAQAAEAFRG